jgi:uncharacterized protein YcfL
MKYALVLISLFVMGCDNIVLPPVEGRNDPYQATQVHFQNDELRRDTAVSQPVATRDQSGLLFVTVPIRNATDIRLYVDYRVTWFDENRQVISETSWFSKTLEARTPDQVSVNSTSPKAANFQVDFRYSK